MSKLGKWLKKRIGEKAYEMIARPIKKIVRNQAFKIKAPTSDPGAFSFSIMKIPIY